MVEVRFTLPFKRRLKALSKRYRQIHQLVFPECVLLLLIYAKSDQTDVSLEEIDDAINKA